jgi:hypothetical protein
MGSYVCGDMFFAKGYAAGKVELTAAGDPRYVEQAAAACEACLRVEPVVDRSRFAQILREKGVPEEAIREYLRSLKISDDSTHFRSLP